MTTETTTKTKTQAAAIDPAAWRDTGSQQADDCRAQSGQSLPAGEDVDFDHIRQAEADQGREYSSEAWALAERHLREGWDEYRERLAEHRDLAEPTTLDTTRIDWSNSQTETHESYEAAVEAIEAEHPNAEIGHDGDLLGGGDRTLVWAAWHRGDLASPND